MPTQSTPTSFPDSEYAHCPYCGNHDGMGLVSDRGHQFVQCVCGARGQAVERGAFEANGRIDIAAMDAATRRAWNTRAGSNGVLELEAKVLDTVRRMNYFSSVAGRSVQPFVQEIQMWSEYLARAQTRSEKASCIDPGKR